jgi:hypothetical protein
MRAFSNNVLTNTFSFQTINHVLFSCKPHNIKLLPRIKGPPETIIAIILDDNGYGAVDINAKIENKNPTINTSHAPIRIFTQTSTTPITVMMLNTTTPTDSESTRTSANPSK